jgi:hypothetical protein
MPHQQWSGERNGIEGGVPLDDWEKRRPNSLERLAATARRLRRQMRHLGLNLKLPLVMFVMATFAMQSTTTFCKTVHAAVSVAVSSSYGYVATDGGGGGYEAFPDIARLSDGRLMCAFYEGYTHISSPTTTYPTGGRVMYATSSDEGVTWSSAGLLYDTPLDDRDPSLMQLPDGRLFSTYFTYANGGIGTYLVQSTDTGKTWSTPQRIAPSPYYVSSPIRQLSTGRLVAPLYFETGGAAHGAVALSDDGGATWTSPIDIPNASGTYLDAETDVIELKNGNLWAVERSSSLAARFSVSIDKGESWSDSESLGFVAHSPYLLRTKYDNVILLGYRGYDISGNGYTALRFSLDECNTWSDPITIDSCIGAYPSMVNLNDGSVLVTYYEEGSGSNIRDRIITIGGVPEPSHLAMGATGILSFVGWTWHRRKHSGLLGSLIKKYPVLGCSCLRKKRCGT